MFALFLKETGLKIPTNIGRREKTQDFTKDARPLDYKTPPRAFYHKNVRSKAAFGP